MKVLLFLSLFIMVTACGVNQLKKTEQENVQASTNREDSKDSKILPYTSYKVRVRTRTKKVINKQIAHEKDCWRKTRFSVCDRLTKVKDKIIEQIEDVTDCREVNYCDLAKIETLDLSGSYDPGGSDPCNSHELNIQERDFEGLTGLTSLDLSGNCLRHLERKNYANSANGFFKHLSSIETINLQDSDVGKLSKNFFNGVLDTLDDGGLSVTDFIYCSNPESPWKRKLGGTEGRNSDFAGTSAYPSYNPNDYCYE